MPTSRHKHSRKVATLKPKAPETVQLTFRLNKQIADQTYALMQETNSRITDLIERGLELILKQHDPNAPLPATHPAFLCANTTRDEQCRVFLLLALLRLPELRDLSTEEKIIHDHVLGLLDSLHGWLDDRAFIERIRRLYSCYDRDDVERIVERLM